MSSYFKAGSWNSVCSSCGKEKTGTEFYLHSNGKPRKQCKSCRNAQNVTWKNNNPDRIKEMQQRAWAAHREVMLSRSRKWRKENLAYDAFRRAKYVQQKRNACPPWADHEKIKEIYLTCPPGYHVDHIIPLRGKLVSGLHVENNLQHLPAKENLRKRNAFSELL